MTTIREYLTSRLNKAEELAEYKDYFCCSRIISLPGGKNAYVNVPIEVLLVEKLVKYNGQEKIISQGTVIVQGYVPHEANPIGQSYGKPDHSDPQKFLNTVTKPLDTLINEIKPILEIIPQISSNRNNKESYESSNSRINTEIPEVEQKSIACADKINALKPEVDKFNIKVDISKITPEQRSHILIKIWQNNDNESNSIKAAIKDCGINPSYVNNSGESLVGMALKSNDGSLFDLLMANKLDFNSYVGSKIILQLILESANQLFITKMFAGNIDLTKSVLTFALNDDANSLSVIFSYKPELAKTMYSSDPLLVLALKNGCYKSAEQILKANPGAMQQVSKGGVTEYEYSALSIMLLTGNKAGVELLKAYGADLNTEVKSAVIKKGYDKYLIKILPLYPEMIDMTYDGKLLLQLALEYNKIDFVKSLIPISNTLTVMSSALEHKQLSIIKKLCQLDGSLLIKLTQIKDVKHLGDIKELLDDAEFINFTDKNGNSLLHLACKNGNSALVEVLSQKGLGYLNKQNNDGQTALHILPESNIDITLKVQIARAILKLHPDLALKDVHGHTPVELAYYNAEFLSVFEELGLLGKDTGH